MQTRCGLQRVCHLVSRIKPAPHILVAPCRRLVVLSSAQFQHIIANEGHTSWAYASNPLAKVSHSQRGLMLEGFAWQVLEKVHLKGTCEHANKRSQRLCAGGRRSEFDFLFMGRRLELKTSQLCYCAYKMCWRVRFLGVKLATDGYRAHQPFDDLYLLIFAPDGFYLIKHDLQTGVSTQGVRTACQGHMIHLAGRRGQTWQEALQTILSRLTSQGSGELISYTANSHPLAQALYSELSDREADPLTQVYKGIPLGTFNPILRAQRIQQIALEVDRMQNPGSTFENASGEISPGGIRRGRSNAAVDWVRDGTRVEVKSCKLYFSCRKWKCTFFSIKEGLTGDGRNSYFDELWLAIYSPCGLDFFKHREWHTRLRRSGERTAALGKTLEICGPIDERCPSSALKHIKARFEEEGAEPQCTVQWDADGSQ